MRPSNDRQFLLSQRISADAALLQSTTIAWIDAARLVIKAKTPVTPKPHFYSARSIGLICRLSRHISLLKGTPDRALPQYAEGAGANPQEREPSPELGAPGPSDGQLVSRPAICAEPRRNERIKWRA